MEPQLPLIELVEPRQKSPDLETHLSRSGCGDHHGSAKQTNGNSDETAHAEILCFKKSEIPSVIHVVQKRRSGADASTVPGSIPNKLATHVRPR